MAQVRRSAKRATSARPRPHPWPVVRPALAGRPAAPAAAPAPRRAVAPRQGGAARAARRTRAQAAGRAPAPGRRGRAPRTAASRSGAWTSFANHGTVVKSEFGLYSADHGGVAAQQLESRIRAASAVPAADQPLIAVYGSADQGDQSAGLDHSGPAGADFVGRAEGDAMFQAWQRAGGALSATPDLATRWTRFCFCGRATSDGGHVASKPVIGLPVPHPAPRRARTGLYDALKLQLEGIRAPSLDGAQANKVGVPIGEWSSAWPMALVRIGDGAIVTVPGEPTMGSRRAAEEPPMLGSTAVRRGPARRGRRAGQRLLQLRDDPGGVRHAAVTRASAFDRHPGEDLPGRSRRRSRRTRWSASR